MTGDQDIRPGLIGPTRHIMVARTISAPIVVVAMHGRLTKKSRDAPVHPAARHEIGGRI